MSLFDRFKRREQRAAVKSDDPYLGEFFGLRGGIGGYVDPGRASGIAVAHACIAIVSQNLAAMPLNLYRRADNGGVTGPQTTRSIPCCMTWPTRP